jgi:hypothetical protein
MAEIKPEHECARGHERGLTSGPGSSAVRGLGGMTSRAHMQGTGEGADPSGRTLGRQVGLGLL